MAALTTCMPDRSPQTTVVWCSYNGECARINITLERQYEETRLIARLHPRRVIVDAIHR